MFSFYSNTEFLFLFYLNSKKTIFSVMGDGLLNKARQYKIIVQDCSLGVF